jgi:hypothetical protein
MMELIDDAKRVWRFYSTHAAYVGFVVLGTMAYVSQQGIKLHPAVIVGAVIVAGFSFTVARVIKQVAGSPAVPGGDNAAG